MLSSSNDLDSPILTDEVAPLILPLGSAEVPFQNVEEPIVARLHQPRLRGVLRKEPEEDVMVMGRHFSTPFVELAYGVGIDQ